MSERRERNPTVDGRRRCIDCGLEYPDTSEYFRRRKYSDGRVILEAYCIECHRVMHRRYWHVGKHSEDAPTPPNWSPPWTPPPADAAWGYCPRCGWAWSNGAGPTACACGRQFVETVHPARVCESVRA